MIIRTRTSYQNSKIVEVSVAKSGLLRLDAGVVSGLLSLSHFVHPEYCSPEMGWMRLEFLFRAADGGTWVHESILNRLALFPSAADVVQEGPTRFDPALRVSAYDDSGRKFEISTASGAQLGGIFSHASLAFDISVRETVVEVGLQFSSQAMMPRAESMPLYLHYGLPVSRLLWRRAPRVLVDEMMPEEETFVSVRPFSGEPQLAELSSARVLLATE